ncbi:uncharacterized protein LOC797129 [Danio rerio]|uniref:Si:ch1073-357b18.4 n=1 Tax=Danio rerio TaxID=7955 RepID=A0A8M1P3E5_DANRE|nr:uncharacterized protein LOC797129 [Danio rerio]XP_021335846.1 uncharacterized protein LOC797129 isoform X1 [Danio rerio]|eukprot:NP_001314924.1 uncharacterized protein LOC797129 [Danio rerio]
MMTSPPAAAGAPVCEDVCARSGSGAPEAQTPARIYPLSALSSTPTFSSRDSKGPHAPPRGLEPVSSSSEFPHGAVLQLMEAMRRCWSVFGARERSLLFQSVQKELEAHGHTLPVERIRRKWNNLIVTYKRVKERSALSGGHAKTSWEYYEMMDSILGTAPCVQRGPASATLVGFASSASAAVGAEDPPSVPAVPALLPTGLQMPTQAPVPVLRKLSPKRSPEALGPVPLQAPLGSRRRRLRPLRSGPGAPAAAAVEERTALLRSFLSGQQERARVEQQQQRRSDARGRRRERAARAAAEGMGRMAAALELICSKQDTIIALLQRLADRH